MYTSKVSPGTQIPCGVAPVIRFAITGNKRTGSSYLGSLLDSHPNIAFWDDEILEAGNEFDSSHYDHPAQFLDATVFRVPTKAVGFKLMWEAISRWPDMWDTLDQFEIRLIHTSRQNGLDSFISFKLASLNDSFTSWQGPWRVLSFEADYHEAREWFERTAERDAYIRRHAQAHSRPRIELEYHQMCAAPELALDFLELPRRPLRSVYEKQHVNSQAAAIENYDELRERFSGTPWIRFFTRKD
jgi:hypothetical protein